LATPTYAKWTARDEWVRSTIALNVVDIIELGLKDTGTAKELWESIVTKYRNKSTMAVAHAKDNITHQIYNPANLIDDHFKRHNVLRRAVIDAGGTISDDEHITNIIKCLPASLDYIKPTLYTLTTIGDVENLLKLSIKPSTTPSIDPFALAARNSGLVCVNPNCKRTGHLIDNCYWPGGGKEGQFPAHFGNRHTATTHTATMATIHRVL
jgi:hypothetical protein